MGCFDHNPYSDSLFLTILWKFQSEFCEFVRLIYENEIYFAAPCILINIFHFIILRQKSMRTSPIYIIMSAIAIIDIFTLLFDVNKQITRMFKVFRVCYTKEADYRMIWMRILTDCSRNYTRRCSTWLSFSITLIRTLVIRNPLNPKFEIFSKPKIAYYFITLILFLCSLIHLLDPFRFRIFRIEEQIKCTQFTMHEYYWLQDSNFVTDDDYFMGKIQKITDGLISRIIPCILFTIVTYFLVIGIKNAEIQRQKMASSSNLKSSKNTSKLVLALTISFFVAGFPLGIVCVLSPFSPSSKSPNDQFVLYFVLSILEDFFSVVLTISTATHMIICCLMSSMYRDTVLTMIRCGYVPKPRKPENSLTAD